MARLSQVEYTAAASQTNFSVTFDFIDQTDIDVFVDNVAATFTWAGAATIVLDTPCTGGENVRIERNTDTAARKVDWSTPGVITEENLDNDGKAAFFHAQELFDDFAQALKFPLSDSSGYELPEASLRKGKILSFNSTDGSAELAAYDGNKLIIASGAPTTEGVDGDGYIDSDTTTFYGPKAAGVWPAGVSLQGTQGNTVLSGSGVPSDVSDGADGDFYIDTDTLDFYGPKAGGSWPAASTRIVSGSTRSSCTLNRNTAQTVATAGWVPVTWNERIDEDAFQPADGGSNQRIWLGPDQTFTTVDTGDNHADVTGHGFTTGEGPFKLTTSGTLPTGLNTSTNYWAISASANELRFATSRANAVAGTAVNITGAGSGTHTIDTGDWLVIPNGVTKISVTAHTQWGNNTSGVRGMNLVMETNSTVFGDVIAKDIRPSAATLTGHTSQVNASGMPVTPEDRLKIEVYQDSGGNVDLQADKTWVTFIVEEPITGDDGLNVLSGSGAPSNTIGVNGEQYIDTDVYDIYTKAAGSWGSATSLVGPPGGSSATQLQTDTDAGTGSDDELLGPWKALGDNAASTEKEFARIEPWITKATNSAEYAQWIIRCMKNGTLSNLVKMGYVDSSDLTKVGIFMEEGHLFRKIGGVYRRAIQWYSLGTTTISNDASVTINGNFPTSDVRAVRYEIENLVSQNDDVELRMQWTVAGVADTAANYNYCFGGGNTDDNDFGQGTFGGTYIMIGQEAAGFALGNAAGEEGSISIQLRDPNAETFSGNRYYHGDWNLEVAAANDFASAYLKGRYDNSGALVDGCKFYMQSGNMVSGTIEEFVQM